MGGFVLLDLSFGGGIGGRIEPRLGWPPRREELREDVALRSTLWCFLFDRLERQKNQYYHYWKRKAVPARPRTQLAFPSKGMSCDIAIFLCRTGAIKVTSRLRLAPRMRLLVSIAIACCASS